MTKPLTGSQVRQIGQMVLGRLELAVIFAALITVPLTVVEVNGQAGISFQVADWAIWILFLTEYMLGLTLAHDRWSYAKKAWLGLVVVLVSFPLLPALFALVRLARLARLLRLARLVGISARAFPALRSTVGRRGVLYVAALLLLLVTVAGAIMSLAEPQTVKGNLWDGMWWAIVTATTVGYGDISPVTPVGRLIAIALMLLGIGLTATLAASVAAFFVTQDRGSDSVEIAARLERVEHLLVELKGQRIDAHDK